MNGIKLLALTLFLVGMTAMTGISQLTMPAYSPRANFSQDFALTSLTMSYSRPGAKNRVVFGGIIPYGEIWRTGANKPTTFNITKDITVNGQTLKKGDYIVLTKPHEDKWEVIFSSNPKTSYTNYTPEDNALVVVASTTKLNDHVESFEIRSTDITDSSMKLHIAWEHTQVTLQLENEIDSKIKGEFAQKLAGPTASDYFGIARYLYNSGGNMTEALGYIEKAVELNLGYGNLRYTGLILGRLGRHEEAIEFLTKSRDRAASFDNHDYVRINELSIKEIKEKM